MCEFWNQRYAGDQYAYGEKPNVFFRDFVDRHPPGRILLPGEGEGRNAVYAARQGWDVTAFDYSPAARDKALALARKAGVSIRYEMASCLDFDGPEDFFDAVALIFVHLPEAERGQFHATLRRYLKRGGRLVMEAFSKMQWLSTSGGPRNPALLYSLPELAQDFAGLRIERMVVQDILLREGKYHDGWASVIRLTAVKP